LCPFVACVIVGFDYSESVGSACIFIYSWFNDAFSNSDSVALDGMIVSE
jgi:hypothetical protein